MKLIILVILSTVASLSHAEEFVQAEKVYPGRAARYFNSWSPYLTCQTSPPGTSFCSVSNSCAKGNQIYTCTDSYENTTPINCSDSTPYCTGEQGFAKCTAFPGRECETGLNYKCPGIGYFPDLYDCLTFYYCYYESGRLVPQQLRCNHGYPFSPNGVNDYKCLSDGECNVPKCSSSGASEWVPLHYQNHENKMAVYCLNGRPKYVYTCPVGLVLNFTKLAYSDSPSCFVECTKDYVRGPYVPDNTRYYECRGGTAFLTNCPPNQIYDPYVEKCIKKPTGMYPPTTSSPRYN